MAKWYSDDIGQKEQSNRREYLRFGGPAVGVTALGVGTTVAVAADPDTVVDFGKQGLSKSDEIDSDLARDVDIPLEELD